MIPPTRHGYSPGLYIAAALLALNALLALAIGWQLLAGHFGPAGG
jgi:hypothetical protein